MMFFHNPLRYVVIIAIVLCASVIGTYGLFRYVNSTKQQTETAAVQSRPLATVTENDVSVAIAFERDAVGNSWLVGTFTPLREHFHLYSKDIPRNGMGGIGRPTLLEIVSAGPVKPIGALFTTKSLGIYYSHAIEQGVPIYSEGPVIMRLPIAYPQNTAPMQTVLSVTYLTCSETTCLTPVIDKRIAVVIPQ